MDNNDEIIPIIAIIIIAIISGFCTKIYSNHVASQEYTPITVTCSNIEQETDSDDGVYYLYTFDYTYKDKTHYYKYNYSYDDFCTVGEQKQAYVVDTEFVDDYYEPEHKVYFSKEANIIHLVGVFLVIFFGIMLVLGFISSIIFS